MLQYLLSQGLLICTVPKLHTTSSLPFVHKCNALLALLAALSLSFPPPPGAAYPPLFMRKVRDIRLIRRLRALLSNSRGLPHQVCIGGSLPAMRTLLCSATHFIEPKRFCNDTKRCAGAGAITRGVPSRSSRSTRSTLASRTCGNSQLSDWLARLQQLLHRHLAE